MDFTSENVSFLQTTDNSLSNLPFENTGKYFPTHKFTTKILLCAAESCGLIIVKNRL